MSKLVAFAAIQGGYNIVSKAEGIYKRALETYGGSQKLEFPNTAYYLPIIYSLTGIAVKDLDSAKQVMEFCRKLLPPHIKKDFHLPYLGPLLDAGMAALFAEERCNGEGAREELKIHYGYSDGTGDYFITIDVGRCDGCGECVSACPSAIFEVIRDDSGSPKAKVKDEVRKKLAFLCPGFHSCSRTNEMNCHHVCQKEAISHTW